MCISKFGILFACSKLQKPGAAANAIVEEAVDKEADRDVEEVSE